MTQRARIVRVIVLALITVTMLATATGLLMPKVAYAASCYGASCNNLDPAGRCDGDAITVRAMDVPYGLLELRYSPSCRANWGRYTPYTRDVLSNSWYGNSIYARVTAWNPGGPSHDTAHHAGTDLFGSSWSYMTDGRPTACTGVEVVLVANHADTTSQGWTWGPCY